MVVYWRLRTPCFADYDEPSCLLPHIYKKYELWRRLYFFLHKPPAVRNPEYRFISPDSCHKVLPGSFVAGVLYLYFIWHGRLRWWNRLTVNHPYIYLWQSSFFNHKNKFVAYLDSYDYQKNVCGILTNCVGRYKNLSVRIWSFPMSPWARWWERKQNISATIINV